jgi:hypothetical protein
MDRETEFLSGLIELQHGEDVVDKLKKISKNVSWAKGWPKKKESFWSAEAYMWKWKIEKEKRELITKELKKFCSSENLDLGAGAYSYVPSICLDFSEKALNLNDNCIKKVIGSLEKKLPFDDQSFSSITAIFVLNYVKKVNSLLKEIYRILAANGKFIAILGCNGVNEWQATQEINKFDLASWKKEFSSTGFKVKFSEKQGLWFFVCEKQKDY